MKEILISVEVALARSDRQILRHVTLPEDGIVSDAIQASGLLAEFPEIDGSRVGIYGRPVTLGALLHDGDRVEIYRTLNADPKEIRSMRARSRDAKK